ncbi:unnamed protein product (macronuclear) [Paramecium tetraurelia]|uniref:Uncharacterized protein n=1 Tax=Paramecium tetraurelia TaxID=5888 RepID=A0CYD7_PARTE|nr:uncharacterized protein GSPATT00011404001 [Paramecium tetraurelia]CAK75804.1 unnamed protein product [Paramecium tetraurelia]|eukprot:XP_001443201.1 hypothetical protein (macronuclear) [Paramecium tetraurelia strain d4-2]
MFQIKFLGRFFSGSKDKQGVSCEHQTNQNQNINGNSYKCMKQLKQKFQSCQHEVEYYCLKRINLVTNVLSFVIKYCRMEIGVKKKCYESCLLNIDNGQELNKNKLCEHFLQSKDICQEQQKQCNQEINVLLDCGHTAISKCWEREEFKKTFACKQICMKQRSCGHSFNNIYAINPAESKDLAIIWILVWRNVEIISVLHVKKQ